MVVILRLTVKFEKSTRASVGFFVVGLFHIFFLSAQNGYAEQNVYLGRPELRLGQLRHSENLLWEAFQPHPGTKRVRQDNHH